MANLPLVRSARSVSSRLSSILPRRGLDSVRRYPRLGRAASSWQEQLEQVESEVPGKAPHHLRLMTLNVAHGRLQLPHQALLNQSEMRDNIRRIAAVMRQVAPDLVALQEADGPSSWSGKFDHVEALSDLAGLGSSFRGDHNPFGVGRFELASGTALMARLPLEEVHSHRFSQSWRDTKGFVLAKVQVPAWDDFEVDVVSVHLDFLTPNVRRRQIRSMIEVLATRRRPLVVLGDLNCCWRFEPKSMQLITRKLGLRPHSKRSPQPTFPANRPRRCLDWILVSRQLDFAAHQTLPARVSDHLPVFADLQLRSPTP